MRQFLSRSGLLGFIAIIASLAVNSTQAAPRPIRQAGPHDAEFRVFFDNFVKAVRVNDKEKIADLIQFPVSDWSIDVRHNVTTGSIKDRADFLKRYDVLFTNWMRLRSVKAKPEALKDGRYVLIWRESDIECSFEFTYIDGTGYRVTSYSIGPI